MLHRFTVVLPITADYGASAVTRERIHEFPKSDQSRLRNS